MRFFSLGETLLLLVGLGMGEVMMAQNIRKSEVGDVLDVYRGVEVRDNGPDYRRDHGLSLGPDGYSYGQKWQCVEFVKRFYDQVLGHRMSNSYGHARDFFDAKVPQGCLNRERGLIQFRNGGKMSPRPDDLLIFTAGVYGHVAIITQTETNLVEIIQQNRGMKTREILPLVEKNGFWKIGGSPPPTGWLRKS